jgi:hypothetical protein
MKKNEIKIGHTYSVKVTDKVVPVRIDAEHASGGWTATNLVTNKTIRIKSAHRLREEVKANGDAAPAKRPAKKKLTAAEHKALQAQHKADHQNARLRDERAENPDGMTASERAMARSADDVKRGKKKLKAAPKEKESKKLSLIDAAAQVLAKSNEPLNTKQMVERVTEQGLWQAGAGKTPAATLYSAILREIQNKGDQARFTKVERGKFTFTKAA